MGTCIKPPSCLCGTCKRCKKRLGMQYIRARKRGGDFKPREVCQCGQCERCRERKRLADLAARKAEAAAKGEPYPVSPHARKAIETRQRKEALMSEWAERARRERAESPLNPRQRKEVEQIVNKLLVEMLDLSG